MLERVTGPECPACGCEDGEDLDVREGRRGIRRHRECSHCFRTFWATDPPVDTSADLRAIIAEALAPEKPAFAEYTPAQGRTMAGAECPSCGNFPARVRGPRVPHEDGVVRYHQCGKCGNRFRSLEVVPASVS